MSHIYKDFCATLSEVKFYSETKNKPRHYYCLLDKLGKLIKKIEGKYYVDDELLSEAKALVSKWWF